MRRQKFAFPPHFQKLYSSHLLLQEIIIIYISFSLEKLFCPTTPFINQIFDY